MEEKNKDGSAEARREIKFRMWQGGKMFPVGALDFFDDGSVLINDEAPREAHGNVLMQFTGLKDRNGREIYEGDIINHPDGYLLTVRFYLDRFEASCQRLDGTWDWRSLYACSNIVEVIGNIYENPELLSKAGG